MSTPRSGYLETAQKYVFSPLWTVAKTAGPAYGLSVLTGGLSVPIQVAASAAGGYLTSEVILPLGEQFLQGNPAPAESSKAQVAGKGTGTILTGFIAGASSFFDSLSSSDWRVAAIKIGGSAFLGKISDNVMTGYMAKPAGYPAAEVAVPEVKKPAQVETTTPVTTQASAPKNDLQTPLLAQENARPSSPPTPKAPTSLLASMGLLSPKSQAAATAAPNNDVVVNVSGTAPTASPKRPGSP